MKYRAKLVTENFAVLKDQHSKIWGIWARDLHFITQEHSGEYQAFTSSINPDRLLARGREALALKAFARRTNAPENGGGFYLLFDHMATFEKKMHAEFPKLMTAENLILQTTVKYYRQLAMTVFFQIAKPRGLPDWYTDDFLKVSCAHCHHIYDQHEVSAITVDLLRGNDKDYQHRLLCPKCRSNSLIVVFWKLTPPEQLELLENSLFSPLQKAGKFRRINTQVDEPLECTRWDAQLRAIRSPGSKWWMFWK